MGNEKQTERRATAVDQDVRTRPRLRLIENIRIADVERHGPPPDVTGLGARHRIEAFPRLLVAVPEFRPDGAGPVTDRVSCKQDERVVLPLPNIKFGFRFEDADQNWRCQRHALIAQTLLQYRDVWCPRQRQRSDGGRPLALDAL